MADRDRRAQPAPLDSDDAALALLELALDGLPETQRDALRFAMADRLTANEIAGRLRCSPRDARIAMRDGLSTLADVLRAIEPAHDVVSTERLNQVS